MHSNFDPLDRFVQFLIAVVALFSLSFGLVMLADPFGWYEFVDTVKVTGPANAHFIRDIGLAYMGCGLILGYSAVHPGLRWGAAIVGNLWLTAHGIFHIYEVMAGICSSDIFWRDAPGVLGPPLLVYVAVGVQLARQRVSPVPLPKSIFVSLMRRMNEPYIDDLANAGGIITERFQHGMLLSGCRFHAPPEMYHMACLGAVRFEDCGPCVETVRQFAQAEGLSASRIDHALEGTPDNPDDTLSYQFGVAIAAGDLVQAAELGDKIEAQYGRNIRTELSLGAASVRLFPALKRGLGYASVCKLPRG